MMRIDVFSRLRKQVAIALACALGMLFVAGPVMARTLSYAFYVAPNDSQTQEVMRWWADQVEKRTSGELKVEIAYMGSLLKLKDAVEGVSAGIADAAIVVPAYSQALMPLHYLSTTDVGSSDPYVGIEAWSRLYDKFPELEQELDRNNLVYLGNTSSGAAVLISRKRPYLTPEDIKGTKLRLASRWARASQIAGWGAANVSLTIPDVYAALQRGTIDGANSYITSILSFRHNEVIDYITEPNLGQQMNIIVMNKRVFSSLSKEHQAILKELGVEWRNRHAKAQGADAAADRVKIAEDATYPVKIISLTDEQRRAWEPALLDADRELAEKLAKRAPIAPKLFEAYKEEIEAVEKEVAAKGYPWEKR